MTDQLSQQLVISAILIAGTFFVHAVFVAVISVFLRQISDNMRGLMDIIRDVMVMVGTAVMLLMAHFISIGMWALCYLKLGAFIDLETSIYFSAATYTTLGYGDVLSPDEWRVLTGAMATNGLLLVGLSVAVLVDASVRLRLGGE